MFKPARMNKLQALVLEEQKNIVIKKLHQLGALQISDCRDKLSHPDWKDLLESPTSSPKLREITSFIMSINKWLDLFDSVAPEPTDGFFKFLFNPAVPKKIPIEEIDGEKLLKRTGELLKEVEQSTQHPSEQLDKVREDTGNLQSVQQSISKLGQIDIDLAYIEETDLSSVYLGTTLTKNVESITTELAKLTEQSFLIEQTHLSPTESLLIIVCLSQHASSVSNFLRRTGFERIETSGYAGKPGEALHAIQERIDELRREERKLKDEIVNSSKQFRDGLLALRELLQFEKERADIQSSLALSGHLCLLEAWVPQKRAGKVALEIESITDGLSVVKSAEVNNPDEKVPILLENPPFFRHFELLTRMYSLPKHNEIDPTILLTITFIFFFATMMTDAFYGLITFILGILMLRGGGKYNETVKGFGVILSASGFATIIAGAVTGGWFGDLLIKYLGITSLEKLMIIDPMVDVLPFLIFAVTVGIIHLDIGIILGIINNVNNRDIKKAFTENFWLILVQILFLLFYLKTRVPPEAATATFLNILIGLTGLCTLVLLIMGHKGMAFFTITGAIGDTLSYARLMALGLCTAGIAMTVNILAKMTASVPFIGIFLLVLLLIVGHLFNWVIQIMGAFVHGIRLHYVEFFGKFYSGGGDEFTPFAVKREITELKM
ncbi:MAG: V-type ATP synthase subunit I [Deltaproteobacteria bacterium]|nr:V-type ATP synthase subunit I [Deltaproteobacteria bacterium]